MAKINQSSLLVVVLLLLWGLAAAMGESKEMYRDPKLPIWVRIFDLMKKMSIAEKIGQMTQIDRATATPDIMKEYSIGSVISGGGSVPRLQATAREWIQMVNDFQHGSLSSRLGIPMIYGIDAIHGNNNVYKATIFPHNVGLGATRDPELVRKIGAATALEVRATGITSVFAPSIAVCRDPRWGQCYESYSEDPKIVQAMTEIIPGLQGDIPANSMKGVPYLAGKKKVAACAKNYVGEGGTMRGISESNSTGVSTVMVAYSSFNGVKMHANYQLITQFLKNILNFRGFVNSGWQGIDRITSPPGANYTYSVQAGIHAGIDMVMIPFKYREFIDTLTDLVKKKVIPMSRIDDAVSRILRVKFTMGLFENPLADLSFIGHLGSQAHIDLAREAVRKSLVLLKNGENADPPLLPLPKKADKILVAGTHANNLGYQCGGWTMTWQGLEGNNLTTGTTILSAISAAIDPRTQVVHKENPDSKFVKSGKFSYAIVVVGEKPYAEGYGDNLNLTIPEPGPTTITNVCTNIKCVVVIISGRPLLIQPYLPFMDAVVAAWLPGSEGRGVADVLFGDYGFTGKLPIYDPLFRLGYGLTTKPVVAE